MSRYLLGKNEKNIDMKLIFKSRVFTMCPQQNSKASNHLQYSLQLILGWYWPRLNEMYTASFQVTLSRTFLVELLGGTSERAYGWADLSIHSFCFDFMSYNLADGCC